MSGSEATQIREIVGQVQSWPAAMRVALARQYSRDSREPASRAATP